MNNSTWAATFDISLVVGHSIIRTRRASLNSRFEPLRDRSSFISLKNIANRMAPIGRPKTTVMMDTDRITGELTALIWVRRSVIGVKHISGRQVPTSLPRL